MKCSIKKFLSHIKHWVCYIVRKPSGVRWLLQYVANNKQPIKSELPWMVQDAIVELDKRIGIDHRIFEWGSGGSTFFFCRRGNSVTSVEHDMNWASLVIKELERKDIQNIKYLEVPPAEDNIKSDLNDTQSIELKKDDRAEFEGLNFNDYVDSIMKFDDNYFDLICVDGRARPSCIEAAKPKLKPGGILVLDNSERKVYSSASLLIERWERCRFRGPTFGSRNFSETTLFFKPNVNK